MEQKRKKEHTIMGWLYTDRQNGLTVRQFFEREFKPCEILDSAQPSPRVFYAALRNPNIPDQVFGMVCLLDYRKNDIYSFGYKDMDETMGPNESECPDRILDLLTPLPDAPTGTCTCEEFRSYHKGDCPLYDGHEYARNWRNRCREFNQKKRELKTRQPKI